MLRTKNLVRKGFAVMTLAAAASLAMAGASSAQETVTMILNGTYPVPDTENQLFPRAVPFRLLAAAVRSM